MIGAIAGRRSLTALRLVNCRFLLPMAALSFVLVMVANLVSFSKPASHVSPAEWIMQGQPSTV